MPATARHEASGRSKGCCTVLLPAAKPPAARVLAALSEDDRQLIDRLLVEPAEFIDHDLFTRNNVEKTLFGGTAELASRSTCFRELNSVDPAAEATEAAETGVTLTAAQETLLFQRFNYARMRIYRLLQDRTGAALSSEDSRHLLAWAQRATLARGQIAQANLPLVLAMAKRTRLNGLDFNELISEGNLALLRSVDKFDCSRGFKFSTYACRAILKSFSRVAMRTSRYRGRFPTEFDPSLEKSDYVDRKRGDVESDCVDEIRDILARNRAELNDMEQTVIRERFALDAESNLVKPKTLEQVGEMIGVTKERVRQIQNKALRKIRSILEDGFLAA